MAPVAARFLGAVAAASSGVVKPMGCENTSLPAKIGRGVAVARDWPS